MVVDIWTWLHYTYVKFVMCMRDIWVVQWCLITKMMGVVCEVVAGFLQGVVFIGCW